MVEFSKEKANRRKLTNKDTFSIFVIELTLKLLLTHKIITNKSVQEFLFFIFSIFMVVNNVAPSSRTDYIIYLIKSLFECCYETYYCVYLYTCIFIQVCFDIRVKLLFRIK